MPELLILSSCVQGPFAEPCAGRQVGPDAIVMTWFTESSGRRVLYIGRAQLFMCVIPPWAAGSYEQKWEQAVQYYM